jgi:integrase
MRKKITKRIVDGEESGNATYLVRDTELKGFVLVVTPAGAKSYAVDYRAGSGRGSPKRRLTIGKHGSPWTPETARTEAKRLLAEVAAGRDPATVRREDRKALTFGDLISLYLAEGVSHKKASTLKADRGRIEHHLRPLLGKLRADRIVRADVEQMRNAVTAGKTAETIQSGAKRRSGSMAAGGKGVAAQCVALVSAIFAFAVERGLCADNPARGVKKAPVRKVERFLSETEIAQLAEALDTEAQRSGNPYPSAAIKLLLLTGCRRGEIVNLCWNNVDFDHECLRLPDSKTGAKIVYLNPPARALLQELPRMIDNPRVIPGMRADSGSASIDNAWSRVRAAAGLTNVRLHDLRHSFASVGAAGGLSLPIIGALLGHKHASTTARYAHLSADPLRAANDEVGARIAASMNWKAAATTTADVASWPVRKGERAR